MFGEKKKEREREQLVTSIAQVTLSYKMKSLESKGYRGNTSLFFFFQPNTDIPIHQKYLEQCTVMYKTVVICLLGCLGCFSMEEYHKGKKKKEKKSIPQI